MSERNSSLSSRNPMDSPLYHLLQNYFDHFEQIYDDKFEKDYGFYRQVISDVVRAYLKCGDLNEGFTRVRCPHRQYVFSILSYNKNTGMVTYRSKMTHGKNKKNVSICTAATQSVPSRDGAGILF